LVIPRTQRAWTRIAATHIFESNRLTLNFEGLEMALQDPQAEPSMEEILASIRRIISEEEQAPAAEPVLDLTQAEIPPAPVAVAAPEDDIVFEAIEEPAYEEPAPAPRAAAPAPTYTPPAADAATPIDTILSQPSASAAAGAMARLAGSLRISDAPNQTIEGVVRELLKPMLKEWLDKNLPAIVESRVEAELERIARLAR
jgi:cell pole-organizing protein PopZ